VALCRFGYMLMGDPGRALAETRRVLRPGGRVGFTVWKDAERNPWASLPMGALMEHFGAPPPEPGAPGMFSLSDPGRVRGLLSDAGLTEASIDEVEGTRRFDSVEAWLQRMQELAKPLGDALTNLPEDQRETIQSRIRERAQRFVGEGGEIELPAAVLVAAAHRA
jgi:SAM-dependent methyltransferase